jgi:hypothetical protein
MYESRKKIHQRIIQTKIKNEDLGASLIIMIEQVLENLE